VTTYRVTGSTGSWRNLPWPFGLFDVTRAGLKLRSWHWGWWVKDEEFQRDEVQSIALVRRFGTLTLLVSATGDKEIKVLTTSPEPLLAELRDLGYPLPLT
jgi:hypothetical protein